MAKKKTKKVAVKKKVAKKANKVVAKKTSVKKKTKLSKKKPVVVAVSGGFDPVHIGHVRMFKEAKALGDKLVVILNNDHWIKLKKGQAFMPQHERKEILEAFESIDEVVLSSHEENTKDMSICNDLRKIRPHIFAKGGDRHSGNIPETAVCEEIGCRIVNDTGHGGKVQSSSWLLARHEEHKMKIAIQDTLKKAVSKKRK